VISAGGFGGFLASVLAIGVVHPPGMYVSAEAELLGGGGGSFGCSGGATKPGSSDPSPASAVPTHNVLASNATIDFFIFALLV